MPKEGGSKTKTLKQKCAKGIEVVLGDFARFIVIWKQISQVKQIGNWDSALKFSESENEMLFSAKSNEYCKYSFQNVGFYKKVLAAEQKEMNEMEKL